MAEAILRHGSSDFEALSAGIDPKGLNPFAVRAMQEIGIDISAQRSKDVRDFLGTHVHYVITVCDNARQHCPIFPGAYKYLHWSIEDPADVVGSDEEKMAIFRRVRDDLVQRITNEFVAQARGKVRASR